MRGAMTRACTPCPHCGGAVRAEDADAPFCCSGCRAAHALVHDLGLSDYYRLRTEATVPASTEEHAFTWLEPLVEAATRGAKDGIAHLALDVQNIRCAACVWLLEKLFHAREGAVRIVVNPGRGTLDLYWRAGVFPVAEYLQDAARFGYLTAPAGARREERDDLTLRMAVTTALAMNNMILSTSFYLGLDAEADAGFHSTFTWVTFALAAISVIVGGSVFVSAAWRAARRGIVHLDLPIALGIVLAFTGSTWSAFFSDGGAVYFDTVTTFIALMLVGRWLQHRVVAKNRRSLLEDRGASDLVVRVEREGRTVVVPALRVEAGDTLLIAPGEMVPVRAAMRDEGAELSLEWIDGEPAPRAFGRGDHVPAGARNRTNHIIRLEATEAFDASRLFRLLGGGAGAETDETSPFAFLRVVARAYVIIVLALAALALVLWWGEGPERALEIAVAVLVVTCPCALGLATPLAIELAESRLMALGLHVRRHPLLERVLKVRHVILDKTGTLTLGELRVLDDGALEGLNEEEQQRLLQMSACSNHPKSRAIARALEARLGPPLSLPEGDVLRELPGRGLELVSADGERWRLGSATFVDEDGLHLDDEDVLFGRDGRTLARIAFDEVLRPEAREEVRELLAQGYRVTLLSGDREDRVRALARSLGLDEDSALGDLSPEDKAAFVKVHDDNDTLMVGDGINDALALDAAYCAGTPAIDHPTLPARADFYLVGRRVAPLRELFAVADTLRTTLYGNLALATLYNVITVSLAFAGLMSPLLCALAMPVSSIVILGFTAHRFRRRPALDGRVVARAMPLDPEGAPA